MLHPTYIIRPRIKMSSKETILQDDPRRPDETISYVSLNPPSKSETDGKALKFFFKILSISIAPYPVLLHSPSFNRYCILISI